LVFREEAIGEKAVFRTRRFPQIFVNEVLKEKILKNKYKAQLTPLDEIRIG